MEPQKLDALLGYILETIQTTQGFVLEHAPAIVREIIEEEK